MKRLLQISMDTLLTSILPIITWIILGSIVSKDISNVFTLTYPLQFFYMVFVTLFAVGPNITSKKCRNSNIVYSNMAFGIILVSAITATICLNVDLYIELMSMEPSIYHRFCVYAIVCLHFFFVKELLCQKLYYEGKNGEANLINLVYNVTNFVLIIGLNIILEPKMAIAITLLIDGTILFLFFVKYFKFKKLELHFKENIKNTSFDILSNLGNFVIYAFGTGNTLSYGNKYVTATNVEGLSSDTEWDILYSVDTVSKIDISEGKFDYKKSLKDAYRLSLVLIVLMVTTASILAIYYKANVTILSIMILVQILDMLISPVVFMKANYIQQKMNSTKGSLMYLVTKIIRGLGSFLPTGFCTYIGQISSSLFFFVYTKIACHNEKIFKLKK